MSDDRKPYRKPELVRLPADDPRVKAMGEPKRIALRQSAGGVDHIDIAPTKLSGVLVRIQGWDPCEFYVTPDQAHEIAEALREAAQFIKVPRK